MDFKNYNKYVFDSTDQINTQDIDKLIEILLEYYLKQKFIFIIGNGGSAAFASHLSEDLAKGTKNTNKKRFKALSLTDNIPFITAQGNDEGYESIFEQQLVTFANEDDILIAVSGSGNSPNILKAVEWAKKNKIFVLGFTGFDGGKLKPLCDHCVHVNLNDMGTVETIHSIILHYIIIKINEILNK